MLFAASILIFFIGWWASALYVQRSFTQDPKEIVIDEVAGQWLLLAFFPFSWQGYALGLLAFRLFDIVKPWPISWCDRHIKGGFGVMFDDIMAALYPLLLLWGAEQAATRLGCSALAQTLAPFFGWPA